MGDHIFQYMGHMKRIIKGAFGDFRTKARKQIIAAWDQYLSSYCFTEIASHFVNRVWNVNKLSKCPCLAFLKPIALLCPPPDPIFPPSLSLRHDRQISFCVLTKLMVIPQGCEENSRLGEGLGRMNVMMDWLCLPFMMDWLCLPWSGREHLRHACEVFTICALHKLFTINDLAFSLSYIICPAVSDQLLSSSSFLSLLISCPCFSITLSKI